MDACAAGHEGVVRLLLTNLNAENINSKSEKIVSS